MKLTESQLKSEVNQFNMPYLELNQDKIFDNLLNITSVYPYIPESFPGMALCPFDIFTLISYCHINKIRKVTEFGFGVSTAIMSLFNINVESFSLDVSDQGRKYNIDSKLSYIQCDLMDELYREQIYNSCRTSDLIFIDCLHSYQMAEYYYTNFIKPTQNTIFMHDMYNFNKNRKITGEQFYLMKNAFDDYEVFICTDLHKDMREELCKKLSIDISGPGMGRCCAMILHPKEQ